MEEIEKRLEELRQGNLAENEYGPPVVVDDEIEMLLSALRVACKEIESIAPDEHWALCSLRKVMEKLK